MDRRRPPKWAAQAHASERVVGEDQWQAGRGTTLEEFVGSATIWIALGLCLAFLLARWTLPWLAFHGRSSGWAAAATTVAVLGVIVSYLLLWFFLSARLAELRRRRRTGRLWLGMPIVLALCALASVWAWIAGSGGGGALVLELGGRFALETTLTRERMTRLKREGFVGVISLLHPEEPLEAELMSREREWAEDLELELVSAPLRPAVALGEASLDVLSRVAEDGGRPWYVHGGADLNRLEVARSLLIRLTQAPDALPNRLAEVTSFERGPVLELESELFLTPFPTDSELLNHYLAGSVRTVLTLLDPDNPADRGWIEKEQLVLSRFGIGLQHASVPQEPYEPERALAAAQLARGLPRPLVVQAFLTPSVSAEAFVQAWLADVPPIPSRLFRGSLEGGEARIVAPNIAVGPRPVGREFRTLYNQGIRAITHVGGGSAPGADEDRELSRVAGLTWHPHGGDQDALLLLVARGGPWYLYGPGVEALARRIAAGREATPPPETGKPAVDSAASPRGAARHEQGTRPRSTGSDHGS